VIDLAFLTFGAASVEPIIFTEETLELQTPLCYECLYKIGEIISEITSTFLVYVTGQQNCQPFGISPSWPANPESLGSRRSESTVLGPPARHQSKPASRPDLDASW